MSLNPYNTYITNIWNDKKSEIFMETKYAGPESKTVPMGFTTEYKVKKKNRKGVFSGSKRNWRNISRKLLKASVENVKQEASTKNPNE